MNIEELVQKLTLQILRSMNKNILLFLTGGYVNLETIFNTLSEYKYLKYNLVMSEAALEVIDDKFIKNLNGNILKNKKDVLQAIENSDLVLIPVLTRNTLSKVAFGLTDNLVTFGIQETLLRDKRILTVEDSFDPSNEKNVLSGRSKNKYYNNFILKNKSVASNMGLEFICSYDLKSRIDKVLFDSTNKIQGEPVNEVKKVEVQGKNKQKEYFKENILTVEDISKYLSEDNKIIMGKNVKITPLAKEVIIANNINIEYVN